MNIFKSKPTSKDLLKFINRRDVKKVSIILSSLSESSITNNLAQQSVDLAFEILKTIHSRTVTSADQIAILLLKNPFIWSKYNLLSSLNKSSSILTISLERYPPVVAEILVENPKITKSTTFLSTPISDSKPSENVLHQITNYGYTKILRHILMGCTNDFEISDSVIDSAISSGAGGCLALLLNERAKRSMTSNLSTILKEFMNKKIIANTSKSNTQLVARFLSSYEDHQSNKELLNWFLSFPNVDSLLIVTPYFSRISPFDETIVSKFSVTKRNIFEYLSFNPSCNLDELMYQMSGCTDFNYDQNSSSNNNLLETELWTLFKLSIQSPSSDILLVNSYFISRLKSSTNSSPDSIAKLMISLADSKKLIEKLTRFHNQSSLKIIAANALIAASIPFSPITLTPDLIEDLSNPLNQFTLTPFGGQRFIDRFALKDLIENRLNSLVGISSESEESEDSKFSPKEFTELINSSSSLKLLFSSSSYHQPIQQQFYYTWSWLLNNGLIDLSKVTSIVGQDTLNSFFYQLRHQKPYLLLFGDLVPKKYH